MITEKRTSEGLVTTGGSMLTLTIMLFIVAFLGYLVLFRDVQGRNAVFFDLNTTKAMRGFWCLIVLLVHIPADHQNAIQDMLGSFAYIGVTFFFMTSSYGLFLGMSKNPDSLKCFWRRRLPKLLLPMFLVNVISVAAKCLTGSTWSLWDFVSITGWVRQLIIFYGFFWAIFAVLPESVSRRKKEQIFYIAIVLFSFTAYIGNGWGLRVWPTESFGFLYGALLFKYKSGFEQFAAKKWGRKCFAACVLALVGGICYISLKHWAFFGDYLLKILLGMLILLFVLLWNAKISIGNAAGRFLGSISYEVYLLHSVVFGMLEALPVAWDSGFFVAASILVTILLSAAVHSASGFIFGKLRSRSMKWEKS